MISVKLADVDIVVTISAVRASLQYTYISVRFTATLSRAAPSAISIPITRTEGNNNGTVSDSITIYSGSTSGFKNANYNRLDYQYVAFGWLGVMPSGYVQGSPASAGVVVPIF